MNVDISIHHVTGLNISTKQSGDTVWLNLTVTTKDGKEEITLFAHEKQPIKLTLGGEE